MAATAARARRIGCPAGARSSCPTPASISGRRPCLPSTRNVLLCQGFGMWHFQHSAGVDSWFESRPGERRGTERVEVGFQSPSGDSRVATRKRRKEMPFANMFQSPSGDSRVATGRPRNTRQSSGGQFQSPSGDSRVATSGTKTEAQKLGCFSPLAGIRGLQRHRVTRSPPSLSSPRFQSPSGDSRVATPPEPPAVQVLRPAFQSPSGDSRVATSYPRGLLRRQ